MPTQDSSAKSFTKLAKIECPKFDGCDFLGWHNKIQQFFEADSIAEKDKIRVLMIHLEGRALQWHLYHVRNLAHQGEISISLSNA